MGRTPQGLVVQGSFKADILVECVRCLNEFTEPLNWEFTELYAFTKQSVSESELLVPEDAQLDLAPLIREYALLEIPIKPLHDPDDSPFSELKKLL